MITKTFIKGNEKLKKEKWQCRRDVDLNASCVLLP